MRKKSVMCNYLELQALLELAGSNGRLHEDSDEFGEVCDFLVTRDHLEQRKCQFCISLSTLCILSCLSDPWEIVRNFNFLSTKVSRERENNVDCSTDVDNVEMREDYETANMFQPCAKNTIIINDTNYCPSLLSKKKEIIQ